MDKIDESLEALAVKKNAATIMIPAPNGGFLVYVSPRETDIVRGLMSAAIDIQLRRGDMGADNALCKIRHVALCVNPSESIYYELKNEDGSTACFGYAPTEAVARLRMADFATTEAKKNGNQIN